MFKPKNLLMIRPNHTIIKNYPILWHVPLSLKLQFCLCNKHPWEFLVHQHFLSQGMFSKPSFLERFPTATPPSSNSPAYIRVWLPVPPLHLSCPDSVTEAKNNTNSILILLRLEMYLEFIITITP